MAKKNNGSQDVFCSFCGRYKDEVDKIIAGPNGIFICDECVDLCNRIILNEFLDMEDESLLDDANTSSSKKTSKKGASASKNIDKELIENTELPTPDQIRKIFLE